MLKVAQFGAGRIGKIHAKNVAQNPRSELIAICDPDEANAQNLALQYGASVMREDDIFSNDDINAVLIASSTGQHARQIEAAATAGKAIFCEKPIDLDINRVREVLTYLEGHPVPFMLAFNRRFDPNFATLKTRVDEGAIGDVEMVTILSRDPGLPSLDYIKVSGGIFRDMMIHDLDIARWIIGEEFTEVEAMGAVHVDKAVGEAGDVDTAICTLKTASGKLASITNSRRASYGYDQRVEVHGSKGMISIKNVEESTVVLASDAGVRHEKPLHFFLERYQEAYVREWDGFIAHVLDNDTTMPTAMDGLRALELAEAAVARAFEA